MNENTFKNPADDDSLGGTLRNSFRKMMLNVDGMLPARVVSYDRARNLAQVQPLISLLTESGTSVSRAPLASVPVLALGGGGFVINFPLKAGDRGWIEASDRDISLYMQAGKEAMPNTMRMHSFSDGRFIPDVFGEYTIGGDDDAAMVIQDLTGATSISLHPDRIHINAAAVDIDGLVKINGIVFSTHKHPETGTITGNPQ